MKRGELLCWIALGVVCAAALAAICSLPVARWVDRLHELVESLGVLGPIAFAAVYVVATLLFVPASAMTIGAGAIFGVAWGLPLVSLSATTSAALAFLIARHFARRRVEALARRQRRFAAIDRAIGEHGWRAAVLLRLSPLVPFGLSNYLFGLTRIRFGPYLIASWLGMLPVTLFYVYLGRAGVESLGGRRRSPLEWSLSVAGLVASVVLVAWIGRAARAAVVRRAARSR